MEKRYRLSEPVPLLHKDFLGVVTVSCAIMKLPRLCPVHQRVASVQHHQLRMIALFHNLSVFHEQDQIRITDGGQAMGDDDGRSALCNFQHGSAYALFRHSIHGARRFIQNQNRRVDQYRADDGQKMTFALAQLCAALLEHRIICRRVLLFGRYIPRFAPLEKLPLCITPLFLVCYAVDTRFCGIGGKIPYRIAAASQNALWRAWAYLSHNVEEKKKRRSYPPVWELVNAALTVLYSIR